METLDQIIDRYSIPIVEVEYHTTPRVVVYYTPCYGCGAPIMDGEEYRPEFCSVKCYCEISSIP